MDEVRSILERLDRIESMQRAHAEPAKLLEELRALVREAEDWARVEGGGRGTRAAARLRESLARDMIEA